MFGFNVLIEIIQSWWANFFNYTFLLDHIKTMIILLYEKLDIPLKIEKYFRIYRDIKRKVEFIERIGDQMLSQ